MTLASLATACTAQMTISTPLGDVLLARTDGFVNVLKLTDGSLIGLMSTGQPIIGMAVLKGKDGKPRLAVGTKMGVHLFGSDLKLIGSQPMPVAAFAGFL